MGGRALVLVTLWIHGPQPFTDFASYEVPRLSSGEAFPQSEWARTAAANQSLYGLTVKLRALGASFLTAPVGRALSSAYGLVVVALGRGSGLAGARPIEWARAGFGSGVTIADLLDSRARLDTLLLVLALLNLASLRSPFVGGGYGVGGTIWLLVLLLVSDWRRSRLRLRDERDGAWPPFFVAGLLMPGPRGPGGVLPPVWLLVLSTVLQVVAFAVNGESRLGRAAPFAARRPALPVPDRLLTSAAR